MRYFCKGPQTATAETERTALYLLARGWRECSAAEHRYVWAIRDWQRRIELAGAAG